MSKTIISPNNIPQATTESFGSVKPDGTSITTSNGIISAKPPSISWFTNKTGSSFDTSIAGLSSKVNRVFKNGALLQQGYTITTGYIYQGGGSDKYLVLNLQNPNAFGYLGEYNEYIAVANSWKIEGKIKWHTDGNSGTPLLLGSSVSTDFSTPLLEFQSGSMTFSYSVYDGSWNPITVTLNSFNNNDILNWYIQFTGTEYIVYLKNETTGQENSVTVQDSGKMRCWAPLMVFNHAYNTNDFYISAELYMSDFKITVDNVVQFDGETAVAGTNFTNTNCTVTTYETPSDPNNYNVVSGSQLEFATDLISTDKIAVEVYK